MIDAVVQFVRNALCTAKNFNVWGDSFLYDPKVVAQYYAFPSPLDQTTPLEILISITQFYAFVSVSIEGYKMITRSGVGKLQMISRLVNYRAAEVAKTKNNLEKETKDEKKKDNKKDEDKNESTARLLVTKSLLNESDAATRSFFVGTNVLVLGLAFFWLVANSLHVTNTDWIGGIWGLIHALTVMEFALLVFLYYMVIDARGAFRRSYRMNEFAAKIAASKKLDIDSLSVEQYCWLVDGWLPFWVTEVSGSTSAEEKMLKKEEDAVLSKLGSFSKKIGQDTADRILLQSRISMFEGYRECLYLILNSLAFYGYLVCIIVFYYQEESLQPNYVREMLMRMPNADADWTGNAVGDFAWTVEPIIMLMSPMAINSMLPKTKKEKLA